MKIRYVSSVLIGAVLAMAGCGDGGGGGSSGVVPPPVPTTATVTGTVAPAALKAGALAATDTVVVMVDEGGTGTSATAGPDGKFSLSVNKGHTYAMVFRQGTPTGKTLGVLNTGTGNAFSVNADTDVGTVTIDSNKGSATCTGTLQPGTVALSDTDDDGIPDVADVSNDEDGDGVTDRSDAFDFVAGVSDDSDGDGMPDSATADQALLDLIAAAGLLPDPDDDNDGVPNGDDAMIPSGALATPTFGALPFEQQMIRFEEFGVDAMPTGAAEGWTPLPQPQNAQSGPDGAALDAFLAQPGVAPFPTVFSNITDANPWNGAIEAYLGRSLASIEGGVPGPAEGRPASNRPENQFWAHQYWDDLPPQKFFKTTVSPARVNNGFRDARQRHGYNKGEFAPGGLYHTVFTSSVPGAPTLTGSTAGLPIALHPKMPVQDPNTVWTFDGNLPPRLLQGRYGEPVLMRNYNTLPIDETANHPAVLDTTMVSNGFGRHTISTHDHNGHNAGEADGGPVGFYFPGQFWDYHWPLNLAGFSNNNNAAGAINYAASDPRAATPCEAGETFNVLVNGVPTSRACNDPDGDGHGTVMIPGDWRETMSTHWFHDHMFDHTSENVYKGNATMYDYFSAVDRGNEAVNDGVNLRLPSGTALSWGNRDYDVHLLVADKATDQNGQLWFNTQERDGFLGDVMTVNWLYKPYLDVRARRYRFRFLNGGVARVLKHALVQEVPKAFGQPGAGELAGPAGSNVSYNRVPFHMIGN
ncbi:MAG: hypothetical protein HY900_26815, partial [Deltaproteobacteria bacterium]|nr:hypothetical protein [Deltaproteobacteria bacterium]